MTILITGGCGFIGSNAAAYFSRLGHDVVAVDNLSRPGSMERVPFIQSLPRCRLIVADLTVQDRRWQDAVAALKEQDVVLHLAAQVAVTKSIEDPVQDFHANVVGTLNLLEAMRRSPHPPALIYSSTNKVYGDLGWMETGEAEKRYIGPAVTYGVDEGTPLDFHTPYGCSKGAADQYVRDYARVYGLHTVVFRQSCIYGPRQFGVEEQGWVAWFLIAALLGRPITLFGSGKQVRDVLYMDDLNRAFSAAIESMGRISGQVFNIGGGPQNSLSLLELLERLEGSFGLRTEVRFAPWRPGDQKVFVCDLTQAQRKLSWRPQVDVETGLAALHRWTRENLEQVRAVVDRGW